MSRDAWVQLESGAESAPMSAAAGFKFTMTDIQAAMGLQQLPHLDEWLEIRTQIWRAYDEALADLALEIPERPPPEMLHARHLYTVMLDIETLGRSRDELRTALRAEGIGTGVHYVPAHLHPHYAQLLGHARGSFPNAEWIGERTLSLPLSRALRDDDQSDVIRAMQRVLA
jgi:dTDP-4-amino-4,6-dideoxygalactose transaminase